MYFNLNRDNKKWRALLVFPIQCPFYRYKNMKDGRFAHIKYTTRRKDWPNMEKYRGKRYGCQTAYNNMRGSQSQKQAFNSREKLVRWRYLLLLVYTTHQKWNGWVLFVIFLIINTILLEGGGSYLFNSFVSSQRWIFSSSIVANHHPAVRKMLPHLHFALNGL